MEEREGPPQGPWKKGKGEYTAFVLEVHVCETQKEGVRMVYTYHDFQSPEDERIARSLSSAGEEQAAYALILNALRRECFVEALLQLQQEPGFLDRYRQAEQVERRDLEVEVASKTVTMLSRVLRKMAPEVAREIMTMIDGMQDKKS